ncbi:DNA-binding CsgD family transcriptional regulator [Nocardia transvalensis]|uniref:DNA-binding CsgD family transcriptional regulator n=1 Tax=Nocardia transvalensis TaxID=37333 RepID=A0A7W9UJZ5_9NOCA|nr:LuxR family transcriptional regulator [Nocardia transvalensis]MBB5916008.1 DNA-binding CsgD family transcriptional regulator [Nocardia transvalensis]
MLHAVPEGAGVGSSVTVSGAASEVFRRLLGRGNEFVAVTEAIAVLDESVSLQRISEILSVEASVVHRVVSLLEDDGLVTGGRLRDCELAQYVLSTMRWDTRRHLHEAAAALLHRDGAAPALIAAQVISAGGTRYPWAPVVLRDAAEEALTLDQIGRAVGYLDLAYRIATDIEERAALAALLTAVEWRVNPSAATRNFARVHAAVKAGTLPLLSLGSAVRFLLWHDRIDDARAAMALLERDSPDAEVAFLRRWVAYTYPESSAGPVRGGLRQVRNTSEAGAVYALGAQLLTEFGNGAAPAATLVVAHRLLSRYRLDSSTVEALSAALEGLIYAGKLVVAAAWCDALLAEAVARASPTWRAIFAGLRAEIAVRQGDVERAADFAVGALNHVPAANQGMLVARPLAHHVRALTIAGKYDQADAQLDRDVPLSVFDSRLALPYLHARGHLALVTGRIEDALMDFELCGALMRRWGMDMAGLVAWRNDLALGFLHAGETGRARAAAEQHLRHVGDVRRHPTAGVSLRLVAATLSPPERVPLLRQAERVARHADDRFEHATVLADLAEALELAGQPDHARPISRAAVRLGQQCGAEPLVRRLVGQPRMQTLEAVTQTLTAAEQRVAELASSGLRNREIAGALGITTSTVEQHLTRVYRKLQVRRRTELRFRLSAAS